MYNSTAGVRVYDHPQDTGLHAVVLGPTVPNGSNSVTFPQTSMIVLCMLEFILLFKLILSWVVKVICTINKYTLVLSSVKRAKIIYVVTTGNWEKFLFGGKNCKGKLHHD